MSRSSDVFKTMTAEECQALLTEMRDEVRPLYKELEKRAAGTLNLRPVFLGKQPFPKRCEMIRKSMALKVNEEEAGELLAAFFMERYQDDVVELLDQLGLKHDEGALEDPAPKPPSAKKIGGVVKKYVSGDKSVMRGVLLRTFAAQSAIDWPELDRIVFPDPEVPATATGGKK